MAIPMDVLVVLNGATLASVGTIVFRAGGALERLRAVERDVGEMRKDVRRNSILLATIADDAEGKP